MQKTSPASVRLLVVGLAVFASVASECSSFPDPGPGLCGCFADTDCGLGSVCAGAELGCGTCAIATCGTSDVCAGGERCDDDRGFCVPDNVCDPLDATACDVSADPGELCRQTGPTASCREVDVADGCLLGGAPLLLVDGVDHDVEVWAASSPERLAPWSEVLLDTEGAVAIAGLSGVPGKRVVTVRGTCAGPAVCTGALVARDGGTCRVEARVLPRNRDPDVLRVVVTRAGAAVPNVAALVAFADGGDAEVVSDSADGLIEVPVGDRVVDLLTVVDGGQQLRFSSPTGRDLWVELPQYESTTTPNGLPAVRGVAARPRDESVVRSGVVAFAWGGQAWPDLLDGLNADTFVGRPVLANSPRGDEQPVGLFSAFSVTPDSRPQFNAYGAAREPFVWALSSWVTPELLDEVVPLAQAGGLTNTRGSNTTQILARLDRTFSHGFAVGTPAPALVAAAADLSDPVFPDAGDVVIRTFSSATVAVTPPLVQGDADFAALMVVAEANAAGLVPLGLRIAPVVDGVVRDPDAPAAPPGGAINVFYAPPHDGLEGAPLSVLFLPYRSADLDAGALMVERSLTPLDDDTVTLRPPPPPPVITADETAWRISGLEGAGVTAVRLVIQTVSFGDVVLWAGPSDVIPRRSFEPLDAIVEATAVSGDISFAAGSAATRRGAQNMRGVHTQSYPRPAL